MKKRSCSSSPTSSDDASSAIVLLASASSESEALCCQREELERSARIDAAKTAGAGDEHVDRRRRRPGSEFDRASEPVAVGEQHGVVDERLGCLYQAGRLRQEPCQPRIGRCLGQSASLLMRRRRQVGGALGRRRRGRERIPRPRASSRLLELPGHLLVRLQRCRREVPRIPVDLTRIQKRLCERAMDRAPLGEPRGSIDRRADKRMPETDLRRLHADEPGLLCAFKCRQI